MRVIRGRLALAAALVGFVALPSCKESAPDKPAAPTDSAPVKSAQPGEQARPDAAPAEPPTLGKRVCLPVAACNLFTSCAAADPIGPDEYRIVTYTHHPHVQGTTMKAGEVSWKTPEGGPKSARALLYVNVPCTATPPEQMPLRYRCVMSNTGECSAQKL